MKPIPTAEEVLCNSFGIEINNILDEENGLASAIEYEYHKTTDPSRLRRAMIEFAKLHVQGALKDIVFDLRKEHTSDSHIEAIVNNAYPLTNIK